MIRERRYIVLKIKEVRAALTGEEQEFLNRICEKVSDFRDLTGKQPLECVVVESDWPEYEPTWQAIADRMDSQ